MFQGNLIEKCKNNDRKAQLKLYNAYCDAMFAIALRFLPNVEDAEDAVQEAFIKAFRKLDQYNKEVAFGAWLKRIVINHCLDQIKYRKEQLLSLEQSHLQVVDHDDTVYVESDISLSQIEEAVLLLPEKYKVVTQLFLIEGYDHEEIASILDISETNSRTILLRGKRKLQELLKLRMYETRC